MIQIETRRAGIICLASTVNDNLKITQTWGLTENGARARLLRVLDKRYGW